MAVQNVGYLFQLGLRKIMTNAYKEQTDILSKLFNQNTTKRAFEEWTGIVGPGLAVEKAKGEDMIYRNLLVETPKRILMKTFGLGIRVHFEDVQDDQYNQLKNLADKIGRGHKVVDEINRANVFNGAFSTWFRTGYDGLPLCSASHPLQGDTLAYSPTYDSTSGAAPTRTVGTWSNILATPSDLDYTTLIDMITLLRRQVSREGEFISVSPKTLLIPPELEATAWEVTKSTERPDTANRATSAVNRFGLSILSTPYLVDPDACFLIADETDLQEFERMPFTTKNRDAEGSWDIFVESMHRRGLGFHDPRGIVGTQGA